jgi:hypothetical protein
MPYLDEHPIKELEDFDSVRWTIDHSEVIPRFDRIQEAEAEMSDYGSVVSRIERIPFRKCSSTWSERWALLRAQRRPIADPCAARNDR